MRRTRQKGFTLIEICIVVGIIGLLIAVAIPSMARSKKKAELRDTARGLIAAFDKARALAAKGETNAAWTARDRTVSAGVRIVNPTTYQIFIDRDLYLDGDEQIISIHDLRIQYPGTSMSITAPAVGTDIRFRNTGTLVGGAAVDITVTDSQTTDYKTVRVAPGGGVKLYL